MQQRCLFTYNIRDFVPLAGRVPQHGGILLAAQTVLSLSQQIHALDRLLSGGAMISIPSEPTTTVITPIGTGRRVSIDNRRFRWIPSNLIPLVSIRCMVMSGNGCRITGMTAMRVRLETVRPGLKPRSARVCCGAARGTAGRWGCAGLRATGPTRTTGPPTGVFGWPGLSLKSLFSFPFPSFLGALAPFFSAFFLGG